MAARPEITGRAISDVVWLPSGNIEPLAVTFKAAASITLLRSNDTLEIRQGKTYQADSLG